MPHILVLATGGTIASSKNDAGASVASRGAADLLGGIEQPDVTVESGDILQLGSYLLEHRHLRQVAEAVSAGLARDDVDGIVITHGTDTMEETAYLLDLVHGGAKPVVLTGAQRSADAQDTDGPSNLREAIAVAASVEARNKGVMISFAGSIFAARSTCKAHTIAPQPFRTADGGPIGRCDGARVQFRTAPIRTPALPVPAEAFDATRVDIVQLYPGADAALAAAAVEAGAAAVVLAGTGAGNGNHRILEWIKQAVAGGVVVGLSTRVAEGPVIPIYGNGGGVDLVDAGAVGLGGLPLTQARLLLALLLSAGAPTRAADLEPYV